MNRNLKNESVLIVVTPLHIEGSRWCVYLKIIEGSLQIVGALFAFVKKPLHRTRPRHRPRPTSVALGPDGEDFEPEHLQTESSVLSSTADKIASEYGSGTKPQNEIVFPVLTPPEPPQRPQFVPRRIQLHGRAQSKTCPSAPDNPDTHQPEGVPIILEADSRHSDTGLCLHLQTQAGPPKQISRLMDRSIWRGSTMPVDIPGAASSDKLGAREARKASSRVACWPAELIT